MKLLINKAMGRINNDTVQYWRKPTESEIKFGEGAFHYLTVEKSLVLKKDGNYKKWFIHTDGLRYNY